ncbi:MAG: hypothetical protein RIT02_1325 [Planctomycetota bacterium]
MCRAGMPGVRCEAGATDFGVVRAGMPGVRCEVGATDFVAAWRGCCV